MPSGAGRILTVSSLPPPGPVHGILNREILLSARVRTVENEKCST